MNLRAIHIRKSQVGGGYEIVQNGRLSREQSHYRAIEREWAQSALYYVMGQTIGIPLARPFKYNRAQSIHASACKIDRSVDGRKGGEQPSVNTIRPRTEALPKRHASSLVTTYVPSRYHELFCAHDIFRAFPCKHCRRNTRESREWLATFEV